MGITTFSEDSIANKLRLEILEKTKHENTEYNEHFGIETKKHNETQRGKKWTSYEQSKTKQMAKIANETGNFVTVGKNVDMNKAEETIDRQRKR